MDHSFCIGGIYPDDLWVDRDIDRLVAEFRFFLPEGIKMVTARTYVPEVPTNAAAGKWLAENGEIEEAARREIKEEAGIEVGEVTYVASQPWPFPYSLMIGCYGEALTETIVLDEEELVDARWFTKNHLRTALAGTADDLTVPGRLAIARHLIEKWVVQ